MKIFNGNVTIIAIYVLVSSCRFEGDNLKILNKINSHYYVLNEAQSVGYGLEIGFTLDKESYQIVAKNCSEIYCLGDTIAFTVKEFDESKTLKYYLIVDAEEQKEKTAKTPFLIQANYFNEITKRSKKISAELK